MIWAFIDVFQGHNVFMLNPERKKNTHTHRIVSTRHANFFFKKTDVIIAKSSKTESKLLNVTFLRHLSILSPNFFPDPSPMLSALLLSGGSISYNVAILD